MFEAEAVDDRDRRGAATTDDAVVALEEGFRAENRAAARKVLAAAELSRCRFLAELERLGNVQRAARAADAEVAVRLVCSRTIAGHYAEVGDVLLTSLPVVRAAFEAGEIDYPRVRTLVDGLCGVPGEMIATVEKDLLDCARSLPPGSLARELERLLLARYPELAEQFEKETSEQRWVRCRPGIRGSARLEALLTGVEGREADGLINEVAGSVCPDDPRGADERRADALMALLHGEQRLTCRCGSAGCPVAAAPLPVRRRPLVQIVFDAATLLGLSAEPPILAGHGPIGAETARTLAKDATWQAILAEMRAAVGIPEPPGSIGRLRRQGDEDTYPDDSIRHGDDSTRHGDDSTRHGDDSTRHGDDSTRHGDEDEDDDVAGASRRSSMIGRKRRAGTVPPASDRVDQRAPAADSYGEVIGRAAAEFAANPGLRRGVFPDGHGGYDRPPPGALTYRPTADLAAQVRAHDGTCRFPRCNVPAARCEIDHIVPFDHEHPARGGWTIAENLQCVCKGDHQRKTHRQWAAAMLYDRVILWTDRTGLQTFTAPRGYRTTACLPTGRGGDPQPDQRQDSSLPGEPRPHWDNRSPTAEEHLDWLYELTWWERHMGADAQPPTLAQIDAEPDEDLRDLGRLLRRRHREHSAVIRERRAIP